MNRGNLLWTGSRMMLAEHRQQLNDRFKEFERKQKPILDEQQKEWMAELISQSMVNEIEVVMKLFDPFQENNIVGKVLGIDPELRRLKVTDQENYRWIAMDDIVDVRLI